MVTQRELHSPGRPPNYGEMVDNQLLAIVQDRCVVVLFFAVIVLQFTSYEVAI